MKHEIKKKAWAEIFNGVVNAKTEEDLEAINDIANDYVCAGILTQHEVDAIFDDFEPIIES